MVAQILRDDELAFGRAFLLATDAIGLEAEGAFWLKDNGSWSFYLVSSLIDTLGPRKLFYDLNAALIQKLSEHELTDFSFFIASPDERVVRDVRAAIATNRHASAPQRAAVMVNGKKRRAVVYRLAPAGTDVRQVQRRFRKQVRALVAA